MLRLGLAVVTIALVVSAGAVAWHLHGSTIPVVIEGVEQSVGKSATLADVVERYELVPAAGDLLDVEGEVLTRGAFPGRILLNGRRVPATTALAGDDRIEVVAGRSGREATRRIVVRVPDGVPANPQFSLARAPGMEVDKGQVSGKLDLRTMIPSGPMRRPQAVALTFDDGPSPNTRAILSVLRQLRVPATFFVVGTSAERYPGLVRRANAYGMTVANHSYSHPYRPPFDRRSRPEVDDEIVRGAAVISALARPPTLFRPPGGVFSPAVIDGAREHGQRVVLWSVDPEDWRPEATARQIADRVLRNVRPGSIVLLHDGGGNRNQTVKALPKIVRGIRAKGLELVLVERGGQR